MRPRFSLLAGLALIVLLTIQLLAREHEQGGASAEAPASALTHLLFSGTIDGRLAIRMQLEIAGSQATGSYYYEKHKVPIALTGTLDGHRQLRLEERSADGKVTGTFSGHFVGDNRVQGTWVAGDGSKAFPFVLDRAGDRDSQPVSPSSTAASTSDWSGTWTRKDETGFDGAGVVIKDLTGQSFEFDISAASGGNAGEIEGRASIDRDKARFAEKTAAGSSATPDCMVDFVLRSKAIEISTHGCTGYGGEGVVFDGNYLPGRPQVAEPTLKALDESWTAENDRAFAQLTGKDYKRFPATCQLRTQTDDLDGFGAKARACGVRGLYTIMESIIMTTASGKIYAAVIDSEGDVQNWRVLYFTNDPRYAGALPKTIDDWRERFRERPIVYMSQKAP